MTVATPLTFKNVSVCVTVVVPSGPAASSNTLRQSVSLSWASSAKRFSSTRSVISPSFWWSLSIGIAPTER